MNKSIYKIFVTFLLLLSVLIGSTLSRKVQATSINKTYFEKNITEAEIVMEKNTCRVLYEKNAHEKKFMASTTKILTAITVINNIDVNKNITIPKEAVGIEGSSIYLAEGEEMTIKDLLYGLMLRSGNDCAVALAILVSGSISKFADLMNNTAQQIGANNSNFINPHGLHNDNHYTTAYDLALISCYAMKNKIFREIVNTKYKVIPNTKREYKRQLKNKNKMLFDYEGCTGIKTGYTKNAGRCLVSSVIKNGMELISVVLNCNPMWETSKKNFEKCFSEYNLYKINESDEIFDFINFKNKKIGVYLKNDVYLPLKNNEIKYLTYKEKINNIKLDNLKKDSEIGKIEYYLNNNLLYKQNLYIIVDVK